MITNNKKKIKICHIITRMDWGGSPDIVRILCEGLDPERFDVTLVTGMTRYPSEKTKRFFERFSGRMIVIPEMARPVNPVFDLFAFMKIRRLCREHQYDIVHTHTAKAGMIGRFAAHAAGIRHIVHTPHGHNFYGYFNPFFSRLIIVCERWAARITEKIICLTRLEKDDHIRYRIASEGTLCNVPTAAESSPSAPAEKEALCRQLRITADDVVVGMVGRLEAVKGADIFVRAMVDVCRKHPQAKALIVGEGSMRIALEETVKREGIGRQCIFAGWRDDAQRVMSLMNVLVLASRNEAVGLVLIEAQRQGIPVIATRAGGIPEIVDDGKSGILVPPEDIPSLGRAIEELLRNPAQRAAMSAHARQFTAEQFTPAALVKNITGIYESLA